jgi:hypothetical protein
VSSGKTTTVKAFWDTTMEVVESNDLKTFDMCDIESVL